MLTEDWAVREFGALKREVIVGTVWHHPHTADGRQMHRTELIWIDEMLGLGCSLSKFYRLGRRATSSQLQSNGNGR
jgi:aromatic ring-cleaving dioxygenase